jgi:hypothetical protein
MAAPINTIPTRFYRFESDQPANHTSPQMVLARLKGIKSVQSMFGDADGSFTSLTEDLRLNIIPEVTAEVVKTMRAPYDWCNMIHFDSGNQSDSFSLPVRNIQFVNVLFVRILPSLPWYRFSRFRNVDGTEFNRAGYVEPPQIPAFQTPFNLSQQLIAPPIVTAIEDADILVDTRARTLRIPPRALILAAGLPLSNYSFIGGVLNVECHFVFGFPPITYESGTALVYDGTSGLVKNPNPENPEDPIDWSSGMPQGLRMPIARIAANRILRQTWRGVSGGMASISVDGASESYGGKAFGGDLDDEDERLLKDIVSKYGISFL